MYTSYYKLAEPAFAFRFQQNFLWPELSRTSSLAALMEGITTRASFQLLTGAAGSGKTILLQQLLSAVGEDVVVARLGNISSDVAEFYNRIVSGFGVQREVGGKVEFVIELSQLLKKRAEEGKTCLLIIDDGQELGQEIFEELRMLLGLEKDGNPLLSLLLVGHLEVVEFLARPANRILRQKLAAHIELKSLTEQETQSYIEHRLQVAGARDDIFEPEAFTVIADCTKGLPGAINTLCTSCLEAASKQKLQTISALFVTRCVLDSNTCTPRENALQYIQDVKSEDITRPTRESVVKTAASVAAAVEAAVGEIPVTAPEENDKKKRGRRQTGWLFFRGILAVGVCFTLYFLYHYVVSFSSNSFVAGEKAVVSSSKPSIESAMPPVVPSSSSSVQLNPLQTNDLSFAGSSLSSSKEKSNAGEEAARQSKKREKITLHPLQIIGEVE